MSILAALYGVDHIGFSGGKSFGSSDCIQIKLSEARAWTRSQDCMSVSVEDSLMGLHLYIDSGMMVLNLHSPQMLMDH